MCTASFLGIGGLHVIAEELMQLCFHSTASHAGCCMVMHITSLLQVIPQRVLHSESVREAVELAFMSTAAHPNILGVQASLLRVQAIVCMLCHMPTQHVLAAPLCPTTVSHPACDLTVIMHNGSMQVVTAEPLKFVL